MNLCILGGISKDMIGLLFLFVCFFFPLKQKVVTYPEGTKKTVVSTVTVTLKGNGT